MSRLLAALNGTEYFLASLVALPLIERTGRRKLMLFGAFGMMASMAVLAGTVSTGTAADNGAPQLETRYGVTATVFLFVFNSFFAIGKLNYSLRDETLLTTSPRLAWNDLALSRRDHKPPHPDSSQRTLDVF